MENLRWNKKDAHEKSGHLSVLCIILLISDNTFKQNHEMNNITIISLAIGLFTCMFNCCSTTIGFGNIYVTSLTLMSFSAYRALS